MKTLTWLESAGSRLTGLLSFTFSSKVSIKSRTSISQNHIDLNNTYHSNNNHKGLILEISPIVNPFKRKSLMLRLPRRRMYCLRIAAICHRLFSTSISSTILILHTATLPRGQLLLSRSQRRSRSRRQVIRNLKNNPPSLVILSNSSSKIRTNCSKNCMRWLRLSQRTRPIRNSHRRVSKSIL
jgi:hypothetical protein